MRNEVVQPPRRECGSAVGSPREHPQSGVLLDVLALRTQHRLGAVDGARVTDVSQQASDRPPRLESDGCLRAAKLVARRFGVVVPIALIVAAGWMLLREMRGLPLGDVVRYLGDVSPGWLVLAVSATVVGYAALVGYDVLGLRHVGHPLPYRRVALTSLIAFGISNTVGQVWLTGGAVRYRRYRVVGLSGRQVADVVVFVSLGFWLGYVVLIGLLFPVAPPAIPPQLRLGVPLPVVGWTCVALLIAYLVWCRAGRGTITLRPPTLRLALAQVVLATLRTMLTAGVLAALLAPAGVGYLEVVGVFAFAVGAATVAQVPGAAVLLEVAVLGSLSARAPAASLVGALVLFRVIYYLIPLAAAIVALAFSEARLRGDRCTTI
jgi:uncharacterized membrane protein YbhN (UPF0104 family)